MEARPYNLEEIRMMYSGGDKKPKCEWCNEKSTVACGDCRCTEPCGSPCCPMIIDDTAPPWYHEPVPQFRKPDGTLRYAKDESKLEEKDEGS